MQRTLLDGDTVSKHDASPVTIADLAVQAIVSITLTRELGDVALVAEEDLAELTGPDRAGLRAMVVGLVRDALGAATTDAEVLDAIARGGAAGGSGTFWTLDPIDGTKGFIRGDQYAIALAKIDRGDVVIGALGCPNLPNADDTTGVTFVAEPGRCDALTEAGRTPVAVTSTGGLGELRFVESVEPGHSSHDDAARVAELLGIVAEPFRIDSQCKYGAVARSDASIYLRLPVRADYREKIWDHAAGSFVVAQAGGKVTDVDGRPLEFTHGRTFATSRGVIATDGRFHDEVVAAVQRVVDA